MITSEDLENIDKFIASIPLEFDFDFQNILSAEEREEVADLPYDQLSADLPLQFSELLIFVVSKALPANRRRVLYGDLHNQCLALDAVTDAILSWELILLRQLFTGYSQNAKYPSLRELLRRFTQQKIEVDSFSGLKPRFSLYVHLKRELLRKNEFGIPFCVMIIDIDHLRYVNNLYGFQSGDEVILTFSQMLKSSIGPLDLGFRTGGQEFTVILIGKKIQNAILLAEFLRKSIQELFGDKYMRIAPKLVTISIGISEAHESPETVETILARADQALWNAKRKSGNCTESAET